MAKRTKEKRAAGARRPAKPPAGKKSAKTSAPARPRTRRTPPARPRAATQSSPRPDAARSAPGRPAQTSSRKPQYYEALAIYENGVRALQRHDYTGAASSFRTILERYAEERELHERSQLYLRVCERETARRSAAPQTPQERVYAATVSLNAGNTAAALEHLRQALADAPENDHAHYMMAVALVSSGDGQQAVTHLRHAIALNQENRSLALHDPDLEVVRSMEGFRELLAGAHDAALATGRPRKRR